MPLPTMIDQMQYPYYIKERRKELETYLDYFSKQLFHIFSIMPAPKRKLHLDTGEWEIINDEKWQALIDKVTAQQHKFLKESFPEFYHDEN